MKTLVAILLDVALILGLIVVVYCLADGLNFIGKVHEHTFYQALKGRGLE